MCLHLQCLSVCINNHFLGSGTFVTASASIGLGLRTQTLAGWHVPSGSFWFLRVNEAETPLLAGGLPGSAPKLNVYTILYDPYFVATCCLGDFAYIALSLKLGIH